MPWLIPESGWGLGGGEDVSQLSATSLPPTAGEKLTANEQQIGETEKDSGL